MKATCLTESCQEKFAINQDNGILFIFIKQIWFSFVVATCPNCDEASKYFLRGKLPATIAEMRKLNVRIQELDFPPDEVVKEYGTLYGLKLLEADELTAHERREVEYFGWLLERSDIMKELNLEETT